jgi:hypothetical protein
LHAGGHWDVDEFDRSRNKTWWMNDGALDRYSRSWYKGRGFSAGYFAFQSKPQH